MPIHRTLNVQAVSLEKLRAELAFKKPKTESSKTKMKV